MLINIIKMELKRALNNKKPFIIGVLGLGLLSIGMVSYFDHYTPRRTSFEVFSFTISNILPLTLPLLAGLSTGDILAKDRNSGLVQLILSKGISPYQYIIGKVVGSIVGQICFTGGLLTLIMLITFFLLPVGPILEYAAFFAKDFAANNAMAYCLVLMLIYICAAVTFSGIALLASVWIKNVYVVVLMPTVLYFVALYSLILCYEINPYCYLAMEGPDNLTLLSVVGYWVMLSITFHILAIIAFSSKNDYS